MIIYFFRLFIYQQIVQKVHNTKSQNYYLSKYHYQALVV